jgi:hypothetical protein
MEMKFAQLVLFDKGFESDSEPRVLVRHRTLGGTAEMQGWVGGQAYSSSISISTTCFFGVSFSSWYPSSLDSKLANFSSQAVLFRF